MKFFFRCRKLFVLKGKKEKGISSRLRDNNNFVKREKRSQHTYHYEVISFFSGLNVLREN